VGHGLPTLTWVLLCCWRLQMEALHAGLDGTPMVLIQGPPGTGKTRTILNLLSVVMHAAQQGALELLVGTGGDYQQVVRRQRRTWHAALCLHASTARCAS